MTWDRLIRDSYVLEQLRQEIMKDMQACRACSLGRTRMNAVPLLGIGPFAVVGEAPGLEEDKCGLPFVGKSGELLNEAISLCTDLKRWQIATFNTIGCRPPDNLYAIAEDEGSPEACRPFYEQQLEASGAWLVLLTGLIPLRIVQDAQGVPRNKRKKRGEPWWYGGRLYYSTYHPAYVLRNGGLHSQSTVAQTFRDDMRYMGSLLRGEAPPPPGYDGSGRLLGLIDEDENPICEFATPLEAYSAILDERVVIVDSLENAPESNLPVWTTRELARIAAFTRPGTQVDLRELAKVANLKSMMKLEIVDSAEQKGELEG